MSEVIFNEQVVAPSAPATNKVKIYSKSDGKMYQKDDAGVETAMSAGNTFQTIDCPTGTDPVADSTSDTLVLATDGNLGIAGDSSTDTITFSLNTVPISKGGTGQTSATAAFNALDPTTTKGDLIANNGTDAVRLSVGTNGQVLSADSTAAEGVRWIPSSAAADAFTNVDMVDEFPTNQSGTGLGQLGWAADNAGTASAVTRKSGEASHPGMITLRPGTVGTGRAAIGLGGDGADFATVGNGQLECTWLLRSAQTLLLFEMMSVGMGSVLGAVGDQTNGIYFQLLGFPTPDTNWFLVTANGGTRTRVDTGVTYVPGNWYKLKFTVNSAGTSVQANINDVDVGTAITTNIPTAAISPLAKVDGVAGGTASDTDLDWFRFTKTISTARF